MRHDSFHCTVWSCLICLGAVAVAEQSARRAGGVFTLPHDCHAPVAIIVPPGNYFFREPLMINSTCDVTVRAQSPGTATLNGGGTTRLFVVASSARLTLRGLTLTNGSAWCKSSECTAASQGVPQSADGGTVLVQSKATLRMSACKVIGPQAHTPHLASARQGPNA